MVANQSQLSRTSAAFALSAAVAVLFNTLLAWVKDSYEPLNAFMKTLSGHHWTTHGLADVILFLVLGMIFMNTGIADRISPTRLVGLVVGASIAAGLGLTVWFILV